MFQTNGVTSALLLQSESSEIIPADLPRRVSNKLKYQRTLDMKTCAALQTIGIKACTEIESRNAAFIRDCPFYNIIGKHAVFVKVAPGK